MNNMDLLESHIIAALLKSIGGMSKIKEECEAMLPLEVRELREIKRLILRHDFRDNFSVKL